MNLGIIESLTALRKAILEERMELLNRQMLLIQDINKRIDSGVLFDNKLENLLEGYESKRKVLEELTDAINPICERIYVDYRFEK